MVQLALAQQGAVAKLEALCVFTNKFPDESWAEWVSQLAKDAEQLLQRIETTRQKEKDAGATKAEHDEVVRFMRESAKPSKKLRDELASALGHYKLSRTLSFDPKTCKVTETESHPRSASTDTLISFALCLAIRDGYWQAFRRCQEPKCGKYFFDYMDRGRPPQRYCCKRHRDAHRKRLQRGSA